MPREQRSVAPGGAASIVCAVGLLLLGGWGPPLAEAPDGDLRDETTAQPPPADPEPDPFASPPPSDPDDTPFMRAPNNQLGTWSTGRVRPLTRGFDDDHRVMLSVVPTYAAIRVAFIGRGPAPLRGGGFALEADVRVARWLFIRVFGSHTAHPVFEEQGINSDTNEVVLLARGGVVQATNTGASVVYALDIGRFVPRVDVGVGLLFARSPEGVQAGQWGAECRPGGVCDLGLSCTADNLCRPSAHPEFHAGVGFDVLIARHWAVGLAVRYYALFQAISALPIYLHGSIRLSARF
ncbi:MAG: hypothetical protein R6X02_01140 [Enhygromyxa sp.]